MPRNEVLRKTLDIFERYSIFYGDDDVVRLSTRRDDTEQLVSVEFVKKLYDGKKPSTSPLCRFQFSESENNRGGRISFISNPHKNKLIDLLFFNE